MIGCLPTRVRKQPIIALYFEFEIITSRPELLACHSQKRREGGGGKLTSENLVPIIDKTLEANVCMLRGRWGAVDLKQRPLVCKVSMLTPDILVYLNISNYSTHSNPGLEVIKLEPILRLKIKRNDWLPADTCPQAAKHWALF